MNQTESSEQKAFGVKGFLLYSPVTKSHFFRVYDPVDKKIYTDYKICAEDIEVQILDTFLTLIDDGEKSRLEYNSKVLGRHKVNKT